MSPISGPEEFPRMLRRGGYAAAALVLPVLLVVLIRPVIADTTTTGLDIPDSPLITDSKTAPNVLFVFDNSGSMNNAYLPDVIPAIGITSQGTGTHNGTSNTSTGACTNYMNSTSTDYLACNTYTRNKVFYDPTSTYTTWTLPDGTLMTGGTSYSSVYPSAQYATYSGTGPAGNGTVTTSGTETSTNPSGTTGLYTDLASAVQTFYVPKCVKSTRDGAGDSASCPDATTSSGETYYATGTNYYRYQILTDGTVWRSEYGSVTSSSSAVSVSPASGTLTGTSATATLASVDSGLALTITITSGTNQSVSYVVKTPSGTTVCNSSVKNGSATCTISTTAAGSYTVTLSGGNRQNNATYTLSAASRSSDRCNVGTGAGSSGSDWVNCIEATPTGRTEAAERTNFATWYSYHRTRAKAAKAGASAAFAELDGDIRVGFRVTGHMGSDNLQTSASYNLPYDSVPIPVNYNNGLFSDTGSGSNKNAYNNKTQWFNRLFRSYGGNGTPLRGALAHAGEYFKDKTATGPYGPESSTDQYACRQNFTILATDGYWNETYTKTAATFNGSIGDADNVAGSTITSPTGTSYAYSPVSPYKGGLSSQNGSPTLADVAMYYWKNDLRSDLSNIVPTNSDDSAFWQHMTTFAIGLGMNGTVDQTSVDEVLSEGVTIKGSASSWPTPANNNITGVDDLLHAAVNGHGTYAAASDPGEFAKALTAALATVTERSGSFSNVTAESASVSSDNYLFSASYVSGVWTGQLIACAATESSCSSSVAKWKATTQLANVAASDRNIFTYESGAGATFPTSTQTAKLGGSDIADYLRGDQSNELQNGGHHRNRNTILGDIIDSSPTYVSATDTVYVGANDGMLHAFDASSGGELFAYVPGAIVGSGLATLADTDYAHKYFVDGPITVSTTSQTTGKNILVGALGRGGKGLYALDVSSPASFSASSALWEATETANGNMGKILGQPFIAKLNNGVTALVTGNGINSSTGHAVLLVYNVLTGALIKEIDTGVGGTTTATTNGLFAPTGWDEDSSGTVDYVYAGDLQGHVWKFDLSSTASANWSAGNGGKPLFTATDGDGAAQPITGGMLVAEKSSTGATWVFFGTGKYIESDDIDDTSVQALYGFIDESGDGSGTTLKRSNLTARSIYETTSSSTGETVRSFESNTALPSGSEGWYVDLVIGGDKKGERIVSAPLSYGSYLVVSSIIPSSDGCTSNGSGWVYALDMFTGTSSSSSYFDLDGDGTTRNDTTRKGTAVGGVSIGNGMASVATLLNGKMVVGDSSGGTTTKSTVKAGSSRVSWREIRKED